MPTPPKTFHSFLDVFSAWGELRKQPDTTKYRITSKILDGEKVYQLQKKGGLFQRFKNWRNGVTTLNAKQIVNLAKEESSHLTKEKRKQLLDLVLLVRAGVANKFFSLGLSVIDKDIIEIINPNLLYLPSKDFIKTISSVAPILETQLASSKTVRSTDAFVRRILQQRNNSLSFLPLFETVGTDDELSLPQFRLLTLADIASDPNEDHYILKNGVYYTPEALHMHAQDITLSSKEKVDLLVKKLFLIKKLPWNFPREGCYSRADAVIKILQTMGIPKENLSKQYVTGPLSITTASGEQISWQYHVAASVTTADGNRYVIDPALDPDKAFTPEEWVAKAGAIPGDDRFSQCTTSIDHLYTGTEHRLITHSKQQWLQSQMSKISELTLTRKTLTTAPELCQRIVQNCLDKIYNGG